VCSTRAEKEIERDSSCVYEQLSSCVAPTDTKRTEMAAHDVFICVVDVVLLC